MGILTPKNNLLYAPGETIESWVRSAIGGVQESVGRAIQSASESSDPTVIGRFMNALTKPLVTGAAESVRLVVGGISRIALDTSLSVATLLKDVAVIGGKAAFKNFPIMMTASKPAETKVATA